MRLPFGQHRCERNYAQYMAKVTPKNAPKAAPKAAVAEASKEAVEAKVAALAGPIAELCAARIEAESSRRDATLAIVDAVIEARDENELDEKATRRLVILAFAEASEVDADEITKAVKDRSREAITVNVYISEAMALVAPKHEKALAKARQAVEKGENITLGGLLAASRNGVTPKASAKPGRPKDGTAKVPFEDAEAFDKAIDKLIADARKSSFDFDDINTHFATRSEAWEAAESGDEDVK